MVVNVATQEKAKESNEKEKKRVSSLPFRLELARVAGKATKIFPDAYSLSHANIHSKNQ